MIAAGLCLMGGCFAQAESTAAVDTYWAAEKVAVPAYTASGSIDIYQHDVVPAGVQLADCHVYTRQVINAGVASFFFVLQNSNTLYNAYLGGHWQGSYELAVSRFANGSDKRHVSEALWPDELFPSVVQVNADANGIRLEGAVVLSVGPCDWDSTQPGTKLRMLDARNGEKDFYVSHGAWGWKWYLLPMRSPIGSAEAVFDFEEKVLVEL